MHGMLHLRQAHQLATHCGLQDWGTELFSTLSHAGGVAYSNYAVGYNNVDTKAATKAGIPVGNTPGQSTSLSERQGNAPRRWHPCTQAGTRA